jgi:hypothetical protein
MNNDIQSGFELPPCQHRWLIEMPNGPTSQGRCTRCKLTRAFYNDPDAAMISRTAAPPLEPVPLED